MAWVELIKKQYRDGTTVVATCSGDVAIVSDPKRYFDREPDLMEIKFPYEQNSHHRDDYTGEKK